jgi:PAS domain S-box-containing protein
MTAGPKWGQAEFQAAIEAAANALVLVDRSRAILFANDQAAALFGYPKTELIGKPVETLVPERVRSRHPDLVSRYWEQPVARPIGAGRDLTGVRKDGQEIPIEIGLHPIRIGEETFVIASIVDITGRKALEKRLRDVTRLKSDMISMVSHEFANQLGSMKLALYLLKETEPPDIKESRRHSYETLNKACEHLKNTTANFLQLSRLESGKLVMNIHPTPVLAAAQDALALMRPLAEAKSLRLDLKMDLPAQAASPVRADPEALSLILTNLITNAVKYTPKGGAVTLRLSQPQGDDSRVRLSVQDTGIGIAEAEMERVLSGFYRTDNSRKLARGFGVGLKVVQEMLERHDSHLELASTPGQGSEFSFTLPFWTEA